MPHNQQGTVTLSKSEAKALETFGESAVKLHNDMQALYIKLSALVTRLETFERRQKPPEVADNPSNKQWPNYDY